MRTIRIERRIERSDFFHRGQNTARHIAAANRVEGQHGTGGADRGNQLLVEIGVAGIADVFGAERAEQGGLFLLTDDIDQRDTIFLTDFNQNLAEVGRRCRMDQAGKPLLPHRFDKAECGNRIDEAGGPGSRIGPGRKRRAGACVQ